MKYHIVVLGCQMNKSDGERVRTVVENMGYRWTDQEEDANLLGVLACSVRQKSIDKVYARIRKWNKWKSDRNLITFLSGCVLPADRKKFMKQFDLVFPVTELNQLPETIRQYGIVTPIVNQQAAFPSEDQNSDDQKQVLQLDKTQQASALWYPKNRPDERIRDFWMLQPQYVSEYEAFIPIQNGCDKFCSYCAVPYTRGREISRSSDDIMKELRFLVDSGYKAITLLGQNVNSYGLDRKGKEISFAELLRQIGEFGDQSGKDFWIYFTSPHPGDMNEEVIKVIASYDCLAKQIHLPVQSGDDQVLKRMNRKHSLADYLKIVDYIRKHIPSATLFTDIIVGFSGETPEQFEHTRQVMERVKYNMAYIAIYSPRPGASSAQWQDDVPTDVKKERLHILTDELMRHSLEYNKKLVGQHLKVLITGIDRKPGYLSGMTEGRIVVRFPSKGENKTGDIVWLKITGASALSVEGERITSHTPSITVK